MANDCDLQTLELEQDYSEIIENNSSEHEMRTRGYTRRERYLTLALIITVTIIAILSFFIAFNQVKLSSKVDGQTSLHETDGETLVDKKEATLLQSNICLTEGCVKAAAALIQRLNESVDPCDDIYEFSCGNFMKNTVINKDEVRVNQYSLIEKELPRQLKTILEEPISRNDSSATILAKNLYSSCMDTDSINEMGLDPLRRIIENDFGGWPVIEGDAWNGNNFSWIEAMYTNRRLGFPFNALFDLRIGDNLINSTENMLWMDQPKFTLNREILLYGLNDTRVQAYLIYSIEVARLLGAEGSRAEEDMEQILQFQIDMAQISSSSIIRRMTQNIPYIRTLKEMSKIVPDIPWVEYINKLLLSEPTKVNETENINLGDIEYFNNISILLRKTPKRVLANFIIWKAIKEVATYLSDDIRKLQLEFIGRVYNITTSLPERFEECVSIVSDKLQFAVGNLYVKNFVDEETKVQITEILAYVRQAFNSMLEKNEWLDDVTRRLALKKFKTMKAYLGYDEKLVDDHILSEYYRKVKTNDNFLYNVLNISKFQFDQYGSRFTSKKYSISWKELSPETTVNSFYKLPNFIEISTGMMRGHFFQPDRPKYMNYGGIGFTIGHEITHGFDNSFRKYDANGKKWNWWQPFTEDSFRDRAKCMVEQYGNFVSPEIGIKINGANTLGENIADNGGVKASYLAYQKWVSKNGKEGKLPGLNYSPNQLFWISRAQSCCSKSRPEYLKEIILTDVHSPDRLRAIGSFSNSEEFSKDFNCPLGSRMNPRWKCIMW